MQSIIVRRINAEFEYPRFFSRKEDIFVDVVRSLSFWLDLFIASPPLGQWKYNSFQFLRNTNSASRGAWLFDTFHSCEVSLGWWYTSTVPTHITNKQRHVTTTTTTRTCEFVSTSRGDEYHDDVGPKPCGCNVWRAVRRWQLVETFWCISFRLGLW